jgi:hypothetical protein
MTLSDIRAHWRLLVDEPTTVKWSSANANKLINDSYRTICQEIMRRWPNYFHKSSTVTTTASTRYTDLPSDCVFTNKILNSSNETLPTIADGDIDMDLTGTPTSYAIRGPHIYWDSQPTAAETFTILYHYMPTDLTLDTDTPTLPPGYHDVLAYGAAVISRMAKEDKIQEYAMTYTNKLELLLRAISVEQTGEMPRVKGEYHDHYLGYS